MYFKYAHDRYSNTDRLTCSRKFGQPQNQLCVYTLETEGVESPRIFLLSSFLYTLCLYICNSFKFPLKLQGVYMYIVNQLGPTLQTLLNL